MSKNKKSILIFRKLLEDCQHGNKICEAQKNLLIDQSMKLNEEIGYFRNKQKKSAQQIESLRGKVVLKNQEIEKLNTAWKTSNNQRYFDSY